MQGTKMKPYRVDAMLQQLKRAYVDRVVRSGFEDAHLYNDTLLQLNDIQLEQFANLRAIIGHTKANRQGREITMNSQGFDNEEIEKEMNRAKRNEKKEISIEEARQRLEAQLRKRQRDEAISILRGVSIRMPLLIFGVELQNEHDNLTLDQFVALVDDQSWHEFMPKNVTKEIFAQFREYYDEDVFSASAKQIRALARAADNFTVDERIRRIADIFQCFRNPDKETVLTPWRVVNMHLSRHTGRLLLLRQRIPTHARHTTARRPRTGYRTTVRPQRRTHLGNQLQNRTLPTLHGLQHLPTPTESRTTAESTKLHFQRTDHRRRTQPMATNRATKHLCRLHVAHGTRHYTAHTLRIYATQSQHTCVRRPCEPTAQPTHRIYHTTHQRTNLQPNTQQYEIRRNRRKPSVSNSTRKNQ